MPPVHRNPNIVACICVVGQIRRRSQLEISSSVTSASNSRSAIRLVVIEGSDVNEITDDRVSSPQIGRLAAISRTFSPLRKSRENTVTSALPITPEVNTASGATADVSRMSCREVTG